MATNNEERNNFCVNIARKQSGEEKNIEFMEQLIENFHSEVCRESEEFFLGYFWRVVPSDEFDDAPLNDSILLQHLYIVVENRALEVKFVEICEKSVGGEYSVFDCQKCVSWTTLNF